jgi:hypothetical protein
MGGLVGNNRVFPIGLMLWARASDANLGLGRSADCGPTSSTAAISMVASPDKRVRAMSTMGCNDSGIATATAMGSAVPKAKALKGNNGST